MLPLDSYYDAVKNALINNGWTITGDPLLLRTGERDDYYKSDASHLFAADRSVQRIAVATATFTGYCDVADLVQAVGQFVLYRELLERVEPDRTLYLAVPIDVLEGLFQEAMGQAAQRSILKHIFAFDLDEQHIVRWMPEPEGRLPL